MGFIYGSACQYILVYNFSLPLSFSLPLQKSRGTYPRPPGYMARDAEYTLGLFCFALKLYDFIICGRVG